MILLAPGSTVPEDLSWEALRREFHDAEGFLQVINGFDGSAIEKFKVRALQPFIVNEAFNPITLQKTSRTAAILCAWVLRIIRSKPDYLEWLGTKGAENDAERGGLSPETAEDEDDYDYGDEDSDDFASDGDGDSYSNSDDDFFSEEGDGDYEDEFDGDDFDGDDGGTYEDDFEAVTDKKSLELLENAFGSVPKKETSKDGEEVAGGVGDGAQPQVLDEKSGTNKGKAGEDAGDAAKHDEDLERPSTNRQKSRQGKRPIDEHPAYAEDFEFSPRVEQRGGGGGKKIGRQVRSHSFQTEPESPKHGGQMPWANAQIEMQLVHSEQRSIADRMCFVSVFIDANHQASGILVKVYDINVSMEKRLLLQPHQLEQLFAEGPHASLLRAEASPQDLCKVLVEMLTLLRSEDGSEDILVAVRDYEKERAEVSNKEKSATKIQGLYRQRAARKSVATKREERSSAIKMQGLYRRRHASKVVRKKREQKHAAISIQNTFRSRKARRRVASKRRDVTFASRHAAKKDKGGKIFSTTRKVDAYNVKLTLHKRKSCGNDLSKGLVVSAFDTGTGKTSLLGIGALDIRNLAKGCEVSLDEYLGILVAAAGATAGKTGSAGGKALLVSVRYIRGGGVRLKWGGRGKERQRERKRRRDTKRLTYDPTAQPT